MDLLASLLSTLRLHTTVFAQGTFCGSWAIDTSGSGQASFHLVVAGRCFLRMPPADQTWPLGPGDLVLFPRDAPHAITPGVGSEAPPNAAVPVPFDIAPPEPGTGLLCGHFEFARTRRNPVLDALPDHVLFRAHERADSWPRRVIEQVIRESKAGAPASTVVVERLVDILFIEAVRRRAAAAPDAIGLFAALRDPQLRRAIEGMHARPEHDWTVASLAERAAMSRSAFAARFQAVLAETPVQYLTRWRMQLAYGWLRDGAVTVLDVALRAGYQTEAAFNRAFKREMGVTPGAVRRAAVGRA